MRKKLIILCSLCVSMFHDAQVGIGTINPIATFHVDGAKDNPESGEPTLAQQTNDFVVTSTGNVGIGIIDPQRSIDVDAKNRSLRVRNLERRVPESYDILSRDLTSGNVYATSFSYSVSVTLQPNASNTITIPSVVDLSRGLLVVQSINGCGRSMISNFVYSGLSLAYISGVARDKVGVATLEPIASSADTSGTWSVGFSNVTRCGDGGNETQFNFTIIKPTAESYTITNNGNVTRTYQLILKRL